MEIEQQFIDNGIFDFVEADLFLDNTESKKIVLNTIASKKFRYENIIKSACNDLRKAELKCSYLINHIDAKDLKPAYGETRQLQLDIFL